MKQLAQDEIARQLKSLPNWHFQDNALVADFTFQNFFEAFSFMIKVATNAEKVQHHPDWSNIYNKVHIKLSTHEASGVTQKDIDLASAIAKLV